MSENISISVPANDQYALQLASEFFNKLSEATPQQVSLEVTEEPVTGLEDKTTEELIGELTQGREEIPPSSIFGNNDTPQAPTAPATTPATAEPPVSEVDADGRAWDNRIDSAGKTKIKRENKLTNAQCWKPMKKPAEMSEEQWTNFYHAVKHEGITGTPYAETLQALQAGTVAIIDKAIVASNGAIQPVSAPTTPPPTAAPAPATVAQPAVSVAAAPPVVQVPAPLTYDDLVERVTQLCKKAAGPQPIFETLNALGISGGLPGINAAQHLWPQLDIELQKLELAG